jgi:hypothetical protein
MVSHVLTLVRGPATHNARVWLGSGLGEAELVMLHATGRKAVGRSGHGLVERGLIEDALEDLLAVVQTPDDRVEERAAEDEPKTLEVMLLDVEKESEPLLVDVDSLARRIVVGAAGRQARAA